MTTTVVNTIDAKEQFTDLVNRVAHDNERVILTRRGKEIAVLIPIEDLKVLQDSQDKYDLRDAIEALKQARHMGTISLDKLKAEVRA